MKSPNGVPRLVFTRRMLAATTRQSLPSALALLIAGSAVPASAEAPNVSGDYAFAAIEYGFTQPNDYQGRWGLGTITWVLDSQYHFDDDGVTCSELLNESSACRQLTEHLVDDGSDRLWVNYPQVEIENFDPETINGSFSVSPRGRVDLSSDDENYSMQASENGQLLLQLAPELEPTSISCSGGLGVRKGSGMSAANATGDWVLVGMENSFNDEGLSPPDFALPGASWGRIEDDSIIRAEFTFDDGPPATFAGNFDEQIFHRTCTEDITSGADRVSLTRFVPSHESDGGEMGGTYSVSPTGALEIIFAPDDSVSGYLAADGNVMVLSGFDAEPTEGWVESFLILGVRKPSAFTSAQAVGHYQLIALELISRGPETGSFPEREAFNGLIRVELRADGTFRLREDAGQGRQSVRNDQFEEEGNQVARNHVEITGEQWIEFIQGTWSVAADGTLNLQFQEEDELESFDLHFSADGQALIGGDSGSFDDENYSEMIFGIRIPPPPAGAATEMRAIPVDPATPPGFRFAIEGAPLGAPVQILGSNNLRHWRILDTATIADPPEHYDDPAFGSIDRNFFLIVPNPDAE